MFVPVRFTFCSLHSVSRHAGCLFFSPAVTCTLWRTGLILKNAVTSPPPQYLGEQFPNSKKSPVEAFCNHPVLALLRNHWSVFHPSSFASFQICHINETKLRTACWVLLLSLSKLYLLGDSVPSYPTITFLWLSQLSPLFSFSLFFYLPSLYSWFRLYLILRLFFAVDLLCCDHTQLPDQLPQSHQFHVTFLLQHLQKFPTDSSKHFKLTLAFKANQVYCQTSSVLFQDPNLKAILININPTHSSNLA